MNRIETVAGEAISRRKVWRWAAGAATGAVLLAPTPAQAATSIDRSVAKLIATTGTWTSRALRRVIRGQAAAMTFTALAAEPTTLILDDVRYNKAGAITAASVTWPDGVPGKFKADRTDGHTGAINAYHITYGKRRIYIQPPVKRDSLGRVIHRPRIEVR